LLSLPPEVFYELASSLKISVWSRLCQTCGSLYALVDKIPRGVCERWSSDLIEGFRAKTLRQVRLASRLDWNVNDDTRFLPCKEPPPEVLTVQTLKRMEHPPIYAWGDGIEGYGWERRPEVDTGYEFWSPVRLHENKASYGKQRCIPTGTGAVRQYNPLTGHVQAYVYDNSNQFSGVSVRRALWHDGNWHDNDFLTSVDQNTILAHSSCYRTHTGFCAIPALLLAYKMDPLSDALWVTVWHLRSITCNPREGAPVRIRLDERFHCKQSLRIVLAADGTIYLWDENRPQDVVFYCVC
jgi:hypothetical protein